jgi:ATP-binding cassette subfamily F protein uup
MGIDAGDASGRVVFEAKHVSKSFDGVPIVRDYSQRILRGDRVGLIGPNGSGKTTALRLLVGEIEPDEGTITHGSRLQIAYFDQQREQLDPDRSVADSVSDSSTVVVNGEPRHVIGYLADFLFPRERAQSPVKSLSGGERNRLMLARLFARPANVLVMDEPTNDLDIETLELLEELVADFAGTVLLVSHDRVFLDNIVTSTLAFEGHGRVVEYVGGYEDYRRQSRGPGSGIRNPPEATAALSGRRTPDSVPRTPAAKRKLSYMEQRELASLPAHIEALETEQQRLEAESQASEFYRESADHIKAVLARVEAIGAQVEAAIVRWMELEERQQP